MFIISLKANKRKVFAIALCFVVLSATLLLLIFNSSHFKNSHLKSQKVFLNSNAERVKYINSCGFLISNEPCETVEIIIPEQFSDVYEKYNLLQKKQGFDLSKYHGKLVKKYSYEVKNYPNEKDFIRVNILIYNNEVIASDVCSLKLDGFMHELKFPKSVK